MRALFGLSAVAILMAAGCARGESPEQKPISKARAAIIAGKVSPPAQDFVVAIATRPGGKLESLCSGTLVAPNVVLTALHCVSDTTGPTGCNGAGQPVDGYSRNDYLAEELFIYRGAEAVADLRADREKVTRAVAKGARVLTESSTAFCNTDVAFIVLEKDLKGPYAPIRLKTAPKQREKLVGIGFGIDESGNIPATRKERGDLEVLDIGPALLSEEIDYGIGTSEFVTGESACSGDSGGPVLSATTGAVIGVTSRVGGGDGNGGQLENDATSCAGGNTKAIYTHLYEKKLVEQAFASADKPMWLEGDPNPFLVADGKTCSESLECSSTVCDAKLCAKRCDGGQTCGADEACTARDGVKICTKKPADPSVPNTPPSNVPSSTTTGDQVTPEPPTETNTVFGCSASPSRNAPSTAGWGFFALAAACAAIAIRRRR